ncbi:Putative ubiquitin-like-specific protease 1B [Dendrobium catenatum]|uniref:Ubiquitin-like-specific protease 1B n=1 Tax=Dendrobium catenatum TaxID=906689 RepID=A0A2I0W2K5_9ASPA|nr:Putative ubiquitin-like-specific protease 1B [Dendrobium catenatum]
MEKILLQKRVEALDNEVFQLKSDNNEKFCGIYKILSYHFPHYFKSEKIGSSVQSSSRTESNNNFDEVSKTVEKIIDEIVGKKETSEDEEFPFPSSGTGGIAKRVHRMNDRKRKRVKTPFTTGDRKKKKAQLPTDNKEAEILSKKETSVTTRKPVTRAATRLKEKLTDSKKASAPKDETMKIAPSAPPVEKPKTAIFDVEDSKYVERAAKEFLDYPGRLLLNEEKRNAIDNFLKKYTKQEDTIFAIGNAIIFRSQMDELLLCEELDTNHIDTFAYLLSEKNKMVLELNQPFLYVSAFHWGCYIQNKQEKTTSFANNITKDVVKNANIMFVPIINEKHWTLLVANMKNKRWDFMDSLPKAMHKSTTPEVISHLYHDAEDAFEDDIRTWPIQTIPNLPTQENSVDCGMFVYIYQEIVDLDFAQNLGQKPLRFFVRAPAPSLHLSQLNPDGETPPAASSPATRGLGPSKPYSVRSRTDWGSSSRENLFVQTSRVQRVQDRLNPPCGLRTAPFRGSVRPQELIPRLRLRSGWISALDLCRARSTAEMDADVDEWETAAAHDCGNHSAIIRWRRNHCATSNDCPRFRATNREAPRGPPPPPPSDLTQNKF